MLMKSARVGALALLTTVAFAQSAPPAPSPAKRAVDERKAIYTLVGANFRPLGEVLQGRAQYNAAELKKRAARLAFLAELASDAYPDVSNAGPEATRAKAEIWSSRAEFDTRLADFVKHTAALSQVVAKETTASDAFKEAASAVGQDCKGCHDKFREK
jgi:cytochrome c556